jgi:hypothetical protein
MARNGRRFSPWWLLGVAIAVVVLFGIGGGLINSFDSCLIDPYDNVCSYGNYNAGLAFISLGSLMSLAWVILFIIFLVSRRPLVQYNPATGLMQTGQQPQAQAQVYYGAQGQQNNGAQAQQTYGAQVQYPSPVVPTKEAYTTVQPLRQNAPAPPYPVAAQELESPSVAPSQQDRICGQCEALVHSPFCPRCGSAVATV